MIIFLPSPCSALCSKISYRTGVSARLAARQAMDSCLVTLTGIKKTWPELEQIHFFPQSLNVLHDDGNNQCCFMTHEQNFAHSQTQSSNGERS